MANQVATFQGRKVHMDSTASTVSPADEAKATRGKGPIKVRFLNIVTGADGVAKKEIQDKAVNVDSIVIEFRDGETVKASQAYPLEALNDETANSLMALGYARVLETYMRNHAKPDGTDAIELATKRNGELVEGKLYVRVARGEGGASKGADVTVYVEAFKIAMKLRRVDVTEDQVQGFRAKMEATKGKDRLQAIAKLNKDMIFRRAILEAKLNMAKIAAPAAKKATPDAVNYLDLI